MELITICLCDEAEHAGFWELLGGWTVQVGDSGDPGPSPQSPPSASLPPGHTPVSVSSSANSKLGVSLSFVSCPSKSIGPEEGVTGTTGDSWAWMTSEVGAALHDWALNGGDRLLSPGVRTELNGVTGWLGVRKTPHTCGRECCVWQCDRRGEAQEGAGVSHTEPHRNDPGTSMPLLGPAAAPNPRQNPSIPR